MEIMDEFTLGSVGEFGRPGDARFHPEDVGGVHGVPQVQTERSTSTFKDISVHRPLTEGTARLLSSPNSAAFSVR